MQVLAIALFGVAVALSAWLLPNNMFLLRLLSVSAARALALVLALVFWVACGRLDSWGSNRVVGQAGLHLGGRRRRWLRPRRDLRERRGN